MGPCLAASSCMRDMGPLVVFFLRAAAAKRSLGILKGMVSERLRPGPDSPRTLLESGIGIPRISPSRAVGKYSSREALTLVALTLVGSMLTTDRIGNTLSFEISEGVERCPICDSDPTLNGENGGSEYAALLRSLRAVPEKRLFGPIGVVSMGRGSTSTREDSPVEGSSDSMGGCEEVVCSWMCLSAGSWIPCEAPMVNLAALKSDDAGT